MAFFNGIPLFGVFYLPRYFKQYHNYKKNNHNEIIKIIDTYPCLTDSISQTPFDAHYFYQGAWLARHLVENKPKLHIDIGSSVLTMGVISSLTPTIFVDFRPLNAQLSNLVSVAGDITSLPFDSATIQSLSCMHVIEHIGLGRYGDPIDVEGTRKAVKELERVLAPRGRLYLTTPIGRERICFNAHKVFSPMMLPSLLSDLVLRNFAWVDDAKKFHEKGEPVQACENEYACGFYEFEKKSS